MHDHDHDHDDLGGPHAPIREARQMTPYEKRAYAVQAVLIEKGIITADGIRRTVEDMDSRTPAHGARVVARAWVDSAFKARLLTDASAAVAEMGIEWDPFSNLAAVENTDRIHNVVVCTLCSCYPRSVLGLPPDCYKSGTTARGWSPSRGRS